MSAPSGYTALDFVGFTDKGTYNTSSTYMRNDLVHYGGNIMRCLVDNTTNVTPVEGANWELWVGASANLAERTIAPLENNPADVAYGVGRQIIYDDWLWEVIAPIAVGDALIDYAVDPTNANIKKSAPVETQLLAVKAEADATDNMIAPTEASASSSSAAYSIGDQLILNNILYDVIAAIQIGDALTTGTGGNIKAADNLTDQLKEVDSQIQTLTNETSDIVNVLGAKNILPNEGTSQTYRGITFTFLSDGSIVATGTADSDNNAELKFSDLSGREIASRNKTYILTGCPSGGNGKYNINIAIHRRSSGVFIREIEDVGNGAEFTLGNDEIIRAAFVKINKGETVNNLVFAPMIRPASVADDTYVPYAMTNRELTEVAGLSDSGTVTLSETTSTGYGSITCDYVKQGRITQIFINIPAKAITLNNYDAIKWQLPSKLIPKSVAVKNVVVDVDGHKFVERIQTSGTLDLQTFQALTSIQAIVISETYFT